MHYMKKSYVIIFIGYLFSQNNYLVDHEIVSAEILLPQRRERVYIIGVRKDLVNIENGDDHDVDPKPMMITFL